MLTAREQAGALRFTARRLKAGLVRGHSDPYADLALPRDRTITVSIVLVVLSCAAVAIYGWVNGPRTEPVPSDGTVYVAETGAHFVMRSGTAHPALNTASALLADDDVSTVSDAALATAPRGAPVGIPGAPDQLPPAASVGTEPISVCVRLAGGHPRVMLAIGPEPSKLALQRSVVLRDDSGGLWLTTGAHRYLAASDVLLALGMTEQQAIPAPAAMLEQLSIGTELSADAIAGVDSVVQRATASGVAFFAVTGDGFAPLTTFAAAVLADGPIAHSSEAEPSAVIDVPPDWPSTVGQQLAASDLTLCTAISSEPGLGTLDVHQRSASLIDQAGTPSAVLTSPGANVVVSMDPPTGPDPTEGLAAFLLVTDSGIAYPVADEQALSRLGYSSDVAIKLPTSVHSLLPRGPELSVAAASKPPTAEPG